MLQHASFVAKTLTCTWCLFTDLLKLVPLFLLNLVSFLLRLTLHKTFFKTHTSLHIKSSGRCWNRGKMCVNDSFPSFAKEKSWGTKISHEHEVLTVSHFLTRKITRHVNNNQGIYCYCLVSNNLLTTISFTFPLPMFQ